VLLLPKAAMALISLRLNTEDMDHLKADTAATRTNILLPGALLRATTLLLRTTLLRA
jgi:hypothetical protein